MSGAQNNDARGGLPERILGLVSHLAGMALFGLMLLVAVQVFARYVLRDPILGAEEITQMGMVFVVMLAMPNAAITGKHIRVDILDRYLGDFGRFACDLAGRVIAIAVLFLLIRQAWKKALEAHEFGDVTNMIELPLAAAFGAIAVGMGAYMLVLALQVVRQFAHGVKGYE